MEAIAKMVSNAYSKAQLVWEKDIDKDRSFRSLHHELISPLDGIMAHVNWISRHLERFPDPLKWELEKLKLKLGDIHQISQSLDNVVRLIGPFERSI